MKLTEQFKDYRSFLESYQAELKQNITKAANHKENLLKDFRLCDLKHEAEFTILKQMILIVTNAIQHYKSELTRIEDILKLQ